MSNDFERYWTSASVYPAASILPPVDASRRAALRERAAAIERDAKARAYVEALGTSQSIRALVRGDLQFEWAETRMVSDDPDKGLAGAPEPDLMFHQLGDIFGAPTRRFDLVSPYFVPTETGVEWFAAMARRGVRVRILTNSLEATDVAAVHAGYAKHRKTLLEAGVTLYEMRRESGEGQGKGKVKGSGPFGSSSSSLHAKTFAVDGTRVFVGSFNFDPRSARLNTELGLVIDSPVLAGRVETTFDRTVPRLAYQVHLDAEGNLYWLEQVDGRTVRHDTEPGTGALERFGISVLSVLPIDWML